MHAKKSENPDPFLPRAIAIYSVGLIGGSLGAALKASGYRGTILGLSSPAAVETALRMGVIDEGFSYERIEEVAGRCDLLMLCSPINTIIETLERLGALTLPEGLLISDIGSTKRRIMEAARCRLPGHVTFIGGHPMAGSEKRGVAAADPYLFQNAIYALTKEEATPSGRTEPFAAFLRSFLGCRPVFLDPEEHDTIAATVSHVPHILAVALVLAAQKVDRRLPGTLQFAAGGFRDMTRIAGASYGMWHDIFTTNKETIRGILAEYRECLKEMEELLEGDALEASFEAAHETRGTMPRDSKGFIRPLDEILIHLKDQPGMIAAVSNALAREGINIKDIEVMKIREGEGGTIRLAFESPPVARRAIDILRKNGFSARERG